MRNVLILTNHRKDRSPGQRFRIEQYLNFLEINDFEITFSYLLNENDDASFYNKSSFFSKIKIVIKSYLKRRKEVKTYDDYDIIFVYREAFYTGSTFFEKRIAQSRAKFIFDFDDAIWLMDVSDGNRMWSWMKNPNKTVEIIQLCDQVFAGNEYLAQFASHYNTNVLHVPTTIDTTYHVPKKDEVNERICIGWTGTSTTLKYFEQLLPVLKRIYQKYGEKIYFKIIVDVDKTYPQIDTQTTLWSLANEIQDLNAIDIGIMPLPDDKWANGKCGFKGLQYMSLEIPTIMSPVGVNKKIINHGVNGYLAGQEDEWISILTDLIESPNQRKTVGVEARKTVQQNYSVESKKSLYLNAFKNLCEG
jgi:glycosyltransferase involved in cell wall biosynthesis